MARYVSSPGLTINPIVEIGSIDRRYNNRCIYTTPGSYTFTVPNDVCEILAVAVGPGSAPCTLLRCVDIVIPCGTYNGFAARCTSRCCCGWGGCTYSNYPNQCWLSFDKALYEQKYVCGFRRYSCACYYCDGSVQGCFCYMYQCGQGTLLEYYAVATTGAGGGYTEKAITTTPGSTFDIVVGAVGNNNFSCVNGQICATGPIVCKAEIPTVIERAGRLATCCQLKDYVLNAGCVTCLCNNGNGLCQCLVCQCYSSSTGFRITNDFETVVSPGCGFGGDINRVGGFKATCWSSAVHNMGMDIDNPRVCDNGLFCWCVNRSQVCTVCQQLCQNSEVLLQGNSYGYPEQISCAPFCPAATATLPGYEFQWYSPHLKGADRCQWACMWQLCAYQCANAVSCSIQSMCISQRGFGTMSDTSPSNKGCFNIYASTCNSCCPMNCGDCRGCACISISKTEGSNYNSTWGYSGCGCFSQRPITYIKINSDTSPSENPVKFGGSSAGNYYGNGVASDSDGDYTKCVCPVYDVEPDLVCLDSKSIYCVFGQCCYQTQDCMIGDTTFPFVNGCYCFYFQYGAYGCAYPANPCHDAWRFWCSTYSGDQNYQLGCRCGFSNPECCNGVTQWAYPQLCDNDFALDNDAYMPWEYVDPYSSGFSSLGRPDLTMRGAYYLSLFGNKYWNDTCYGNGCQGCDVVNRNGQSYFLGCVFNTCQNSCCVPMSLSEVCNHYYDLMYKPGYCNNNWSMQIVPNILNLFMCSGNCLNNMDRFGCTRTCVSINSWNCCRTLTAQNCINSYQAQTFNCWHDYWPVCVGYDYRTGTRQLNSNPIINLYQLTCDVMQNSNEDSNAAVFTCHPYCTRVLNQEFFGSNSGLHGPEALSRLYYGANHTKDCCCCVWKSIDQISIDDDDFYWNWVSIANIQYSRTMNVDHPNGCQCCSFCADVSYIEFNKSNFTYRNGCCVNIDTDAQGGAGTATPGNWQSSIAATQASSSGGYIKCVDIICKGCCFTQCPYLKVTGGGGQGAELKPIMEFYCCNCNISGCQYAMGRIVGVEVVCGGSGYTSEPSIAICGGVGGWCCYFTQNCNYTYGCVVFCTCVAPVQAGASANHVSYGSGGGTVVGVNNVAKDLNVIDSSAIQSVIPGRGGRGCEPEYEPFYYSYPGISAKVSQRADPRKQMAGCAVGIGW